MSSISELLEALESISDDGGRITVREGDYEVTETIVLDKDNVTVEGMGPGTRFTLGDDVNCPVFVIGDVSDEEPDRIVRNITLRDMLIDGNRENQTSELCLDPRRLFLRNNCITVRGSVDTTVENVALQGARSGGIVTEHGCENILIRRVVAYDNFFDGIACYETTRSTIVECTSRNNLAAGLSCDLGFNENIVADSFFVMNGSVGIFWRDSSGNLVSQSFMTDNEEDGVFLADGEGLGELPTADNVFDACFFIRNGRFGIWQAGQNSRGNILYGGIFAENEDGDVEESFPLLAPLTLFDTIMLP